MESTFEAVRTEALFASMLQASQPPVEGAIREAVTMTLRRLGSRGCADVVAGEYGDHPDTAVTRMSWALAQVRGVYGDPMIVAPRVLAFAG
jgi:hypothetical protein